MAKSYIDLLLPVGRMVFGDVNKGRQRTDSKTNALRVNQDGTPMMDFTAGVAVRKAGETHWNQTAWGQVIFAHGQKEWPNGQWQHRDFSWKIIDGDSTEVNKKGKRPCDQEGYAGHWIIVCSNGQAPQLTDRMGKVHLTDRSAVVPGRFVQPFISIAGNESQDSPGIYLNLKILAYSAWGEEIVSSNAPDPSTVGFGQGALPAGASEIPQGQTAGTPAASAPAPQPQAQASAAPAPTAVAPAAGFSNGPAAPPPAAAAPAPSAPRPQPQKRMTAKATTTYEEYVKAGWSDEVMIQHGILEIA